ncbi:MAG: hypothetical protein ACRYGB_04485 [Janthinobacterium lividum]
MKKSNSITNTITKRTKATVTYNESVKQAYAQILKQTKALLSTIEEEPLRHIRIRKIKQPFEEYPVIVNELISPLIYLQLGWYHDHYRLYFGFNINKTGHSCHEITSQFLRILYRFTMKGSTAHNIEDCIHIDCMITNCDDFYEYVSYKEEEKYLNRIIRHQSKTVKRNLQRVA